MSYSGWFMRGGKFSSATERARDSGVENRRTDKGHGEQIWTFSGAN